MKNIIVLMLAGNLLLVGCDSGPKGERVYMQVCGSTFTFYKKEAEVEYSNFTGRGKVVLTEGSGTMLCSKYSDELVPDEPGEIQRYTFDISPFRDDEQLVVFFAHKDEHFGFVNFKRVQLFPAASRSIKIIRDPVSLKVHID